MGKVIAIDGPAGSGKSTVSKIIAKRLNYTYIDTGAMYRVIAYLALKNNVVDNQAEIIKLAESANIEFNNEKVYVNGIDVTNEIRSMEVSKIVSPISSITPLREILVKMQRDMASNLDVIMEGRDITTVVFPNADYKFYLDATLEERANRRYKDILKKENNISYEEILENMKKRDYNDMHKEVGSLIRTSDAIYIDSTNMTVEEVISKIIKEVK